jgi:hypothetical protein
MLVDTSVAIGDHGDLAGLLAYEDLCDLEAFLGQLLSPWVVHAKSHGSPNSSGCSTLANMHPPNGWARNRLLEHEHPLRCRRPRQATPVVPVPPPTPTLPNPAVVGRGSVPAHWTPELTVPRRLPERGCVRAKQPFEAWHSKDGEIQLMGAVVFIPDARCLCVATLR